MWDSAPTLDEEEEALESGGFRSLMSMLQSSPVEAQSDS
jgi:hypothetical protein